MDPLTAIAFIAAVLALFGVAAAGTLVTLAACSVASYAISKGGAMRFTTFLLLAAGSGYLLWVALVALASAGGLTP